MFVQLRTYTLQPGVLDRWVEVFTREIRPLRESLGFSIPAAWTEPDRDRFVWLMAFAGTREEWDTQDAAFHDSPERRALEPDPAGLIVSIETRFVDLLP